MCHPPGMDEVFGGFFITSTGCSSTTKHGYRVEGVRGVLGHKDLVIGMFAGLLALTWGLFGACRRASFPVQDEQYLGDDSRPAGRFPSFARWPGRVVASAWPTSA